MLASYFVQMSKFIKESQPDARDRVPVSIMLSSFHNRSTDSLWVAHVHEDLNPLSPPPVWSFTHIFRFREVKFCLQ